MRMRNNCLDSTSGILLRQKATRSSLKHASDAASWKHMPLTADADDGAFIICRDGSFRREAVREEQGREVTQARRQTGIGGMHLSL